MMNNTLIFKPKSKKLNQERSTTDYIVLWCYPSDDRRLNQLYIHQDDFLFLAVAYGIAIDHSGLDIYECYALKKQDWLKLLNEARKLVRFNSFKDMYDYLQQVKQEIAYDYTYSLTHIVKPGETISSIMLQVFPGGKGLNQSIALARADSEVYHAGCIG